MAVGLRVLTSRRTYGANVSPDQQHGIDLLRNLRDSCGFLTSVLMRWPLLQVVNSMGGRKRPTHVLFCMVDHYEPGIVGGDSRVHMQGVAELLDRYPRLADAHGDASGRPPRRTWFFPPHEHRYGSLRQLASLCERGYGEIELHLHHGKTSPDTPENVRRTIELCLRDYSQFGVFGTESGRPRYGFVHGDWALNNSLDGRFCGVNSELSILQETGCYADFTFPSCIRNNPRRINRLYYANVDLHRPKSISSGVLARAGAGSQKGLLMVQGPVRPVWVDGRLTFGDSISDSRPPVRKLIDAWVGTTIHVAGKRDWIIVKVHTHGAGSREAVLGDAMDEAFTYLETAYNDGSRYVLHYVTARELFNMISAAEAGETGDPADYRDYRIKPPCFDSSPEILEASAELRDAVATTYCY